MYTATGTAEVHYERHLRLFTDCLQDSEHNQTWLTRWQMLQQKRA